jgi:hypothetical protein
MPRAEAMIFTASYNLQDAIRESIEQTNNGGTREVIRYLQMHFREVLDDNQMTIEHLGLGPLIRAQRKKPAYQDVERKIKNLCFDFGLPPLDLDDEISVPVDMANVLSSECDWPELDDATIDDLDKHFKLREAQRLAHDARTQCYLMLRQAAAKFVPGRTDIPLRELRRIAKGRSGK